MLNLTARGIVNHGIASNRRRARQRLFQSTGLRCGVAVSAIAAGLAMPSVAYAQDRTYVGPGTQWTTPGNWGGDAPDSAGETAVFANNGAPTANVAVTTNLVVNGVRYDAAAPSRAIDLSSFLATFGTGIANNSGNVQTINVNGVQGSTSLQLAGTSDVTGTQTNVNLTSGFMQIAQTANASRANVITGANGILSLETSDGTATVGALSGNGTVIAILNNGAIPNQVLTVGGLNLSTAFSGAITQNSNTTLGLVVTGTGTLSLTGSGNNYSGGTTIDSGATLQIGGGGTSGVIGSGTVTDNGRLVINRSDNITFANAVTGTGTFVQSGSGRVTLTGNNTFSGGSSIGVGTLLAGSANAFGTGGMTFILGGTVGTAAGTSATLNGVTVNSGQTATLGAAAGQTLSLTGTLNMASAAGTALHFGTAGQTGTVDFGFSSVGLVPNAGSVSVDAGTLRMTNNTGAFFFLNVNGGLTINSGATYDINGQIGAGVNLTGGGTIINNGGAANTFQAQQSGNSVFSGVIRDGTAATNLLVRGGGFLTLTGANTYSGTTTFSGNSTLQLGTAGTTGSLGNGAIDLTNGQLIVNRSNAITLANTITGTGSLTQAGTGVTTLTGANTYTGATNLQQGTLQVGNTNALGTGTLTFAGGGVATTLRGITTASVGNNLTFTNGANATIAAAAGTTLTLNGSAFNIDANNPGTQLHFGSASDTGTVVFGPSFGVVAGSSGYDLSVDGGTLQSGSSNTLTFLTSLNNVTTTVAAGATLDYSPFGSGNINNLLGAGTILDDGSTTSVRNGLFSGTFAGSQGVKAIGGGTLILTGANTYTGATTFSGNATLQIGNGGTTGSIGDGAIDLTGGQLVVNRSDAVTLANAISGTGALTQAGSGTTTLTSANTYTGATNLNAGTLQAGASNAFGTGNLTFAGGAATIVRGLTTASLGNSFTFSNGADATIAAAAGTTLTLSGTAFSINANTAGTQLHFGGASDAGTVVFGPAIGVVVGGAGYDVFVDGGTLRSGSNNTLTFLTSLANVDTTVASGATLDYSPYGSGNINNLLGSGTVLDDGSTTSIRNGLFAGDLAGTQNVRVIGGGTLVLTGANTYSGATTFTGNATLQLGDGGTTGAIGTGAIDLTAGRLVVDRSNAVTLANTISGSGSLVQAGSGTTTLTGSNTPASNFTGSVLVTAGGLAINASFGDTLANSATLVTAAGTTLSGSGTFLGSATVNGAINPGNSPGTLTIAGNLTTGPGTIFNYELGQAGVIGPPNNDLVVVGGNLTLDGTLNVTALPGFSTGYYRLINYGGTLTDNGLLFGATPSGYTSTLLLNVPGQVNALFNNGAQIVQYWDGTDFVGASTAFGGDGGSGTWNTAGTNWTTAPGYSINSNWAGQVGVFAGAAGGTVTISGQQAFQELRFQTGGYVLNGATAADGLLTTGGFSVIDVATGQAATINAAIAGTGGLTKTGAGQLILGGNNAYTGLTTVAAGRLDVGAGATLASSVLNNATFVNSATGTVNGDVSNAATGTFTSLGVINGGLTNSGTASVSGQLNGAVDNQGGTVTLANVTGIGALSQTAVGTLLVNSSVSVGSLSGAGSVQIANAATLTTNGNNGSTTFAGVISGAGAVTKAGTGTLVLTGANTYAGTTTVSGGTLMLGNGAATGSIGAGAIVDNGIVAINRSDVVALDNAISGTGSLQQIGSGTTILGGANTYTGGTLISAGRLVGNTTSLQGAITDNGTLEFAQAGAGTYAGSLSGSGAFEKTGVGRLTFSGNSAAFLGATRVLGGELTVNGSLAGSTVTVGSGATLSGTGPIGGLVAQNGSTVSPGSGIGTLVVNGNVTFQAGSTYLAQITSAGADRISATGTAQLGGTLALNNLGGSYAYGSTYVLLDAAGGRTGSFSVTGLNFGNQFRPRIIYTPTEVQLLLAPNVLTPLVGAVPLTPNQSRFVAAYDAAVFAGLNTQPFDALYNLSSADLASATDQLSGGIYPTLTRSILEDERLTRDAVLTRIAEVQDLKMTRAGLWAQGFGSWGGGSSDGNAARFTRDSTGGIMGIDVGGSFTNGTFRIGAYSYYLDTKLGVAALGSRSDIERTGGGLYAGTTFGNVSANIGASYSDLRGKVTRSIAFPGFTGVASSRPRGEVVQVFGELSYRIDLHGDAFVKPFLAGSIASVRLDAIAETGPVQRVNVAKQRNDLETVDIGMAGGITLGGLRLDGRLAGRRWLGDRRITSSIALDLAPQQPFLIAAAPVGQWGLTSGLNASVGIGAVTATVSYTGLYSRAATDNAVRGTLAIRF